MKASVVVGVDLGGTWLRVVALRADGRRLRSWRGKAPPLAELPRLLRRRWHRWGLRSSGVGGLVVAARGVWARSERERQARRLRRLAVRVRVIADVEAAYLGAFGSRPGILLLAGTGSIALGRDGTGRWVRRGGLGPLLGDEGSAFWIGREYLRTYRGEASGLREILRSPDAVARIATHAARILRQAERGDPRARAIVRTAQHHLAALILDLARALRLKAPVPLSWAGGLLERPKFRAGVFRASRALGLRIKPVAPRDPPVLAAARLALRGDRMLEGRGGVLYTKSALLRDSSRHTQGDPNE